MHDAEPRRIESIRDALTVVGSAAASFTELMECVAVAKASSDWQLRHRAAERAFAEMKVGTPNAAKHLSGAAEVVIDTFLKSASSLTELPPEVKAAEAWLDAHRPKLEIAGARDFADEKVKLLAQLLVLLSDSEPEAKVRLCSRLRKVDRSDLAIQAARPVANRYRTNVPALTTLGAAYCDMAQYDKAERVLRAALKVQPADARARIALSRVLQESGREYEAFDEAKLAFAGETSTYTAHRLLAAAAAIGNAESFDLAVAEVEAAAERREEGKPDVYLLLLAGEALVEQGRANEVVDIIDRIAAVGSPLRGQSAKRFAEMKQAARSATRMTLFDSQGT